MVMQQDVWRQQAVGVRAFLSDGVWYQYLYTFSFLVL